MRQAPEHEAYEEQLKRFKRMHMGSKPARAKLISSNMRLAMSIAKRYSRNGYIHPEDLLSVAMLGLIKAVDTFDENKGAKFSTYAFYCIDSAIKVSLRNERRRIRTVSLDQKLGDADSLLEHPRAQSGLIVSGIEGQIEVSDEVGRMMHYFARLDEREQLVLSRRFGLFSYEEATLSDIAEQLGCVKMTVSNVERRALRKLRAMMSIASSGTIRGD